MSCRVERGGIISKVKIVRRKRSDGSLFKCATPISVCRDKFVRDSKPGIISTVTTPRILHFVMRKKL